MEVKAKLAPYAALVQEAEAEVLGETTSTLNFEECTFGECALGDFLVDAMVDYAKSLKPEFHHIGFIQRGNIKSSIPSGNITKGVIFELLPFNDRIEAFELQGNDILKALERSFSNAWAYKPFKGPYVLQVSGLQVTYNLSFPDGQRVTSVYVGYSKSSIPLDPETFYHVIAPAYLSDGGDGFTMFKNGKRNMEYVGRDEKVMELYIKKNSPLNIKTDGRIIVNQ